MVYVVIYYIHIHLVITLFKKFLTVITQARWGWVGGGGGGCLDICGISRLILGHSIILVLYNFHAHSEF